MPANRSGTIVKARDEDPVIFLNSSDATTVARFTCAHELGHFVLRRGDSEFEYVDNRDELSGAGTNDAERFANAFAAALLMPRDVVKERAPFTEVVVLASQFRVSPEAMRHRIENLKSE